jgi:hypothetical protein
MCVKAEESSNVRVCTYALFVLTMRMFRISEHAILPCAAVSLQKEAFESYMLRNQQKKSEILILG